MQTGIKRQAHTRATGVLRRRDAKRIARTLHREIAVAADRSGETAHIAAERDVVQFQRAAARGIVQRDAAGEIDAVDRQRGEIGIVGRHRPVNAAFLIETEIERDAVDGEFGGAPFAAHQRAETKLDREVVSTDAAGIVGAADHDRLKAQRGRRQQCRIQRSANAHRRAKNAARLDLELRTKPGPVNEVRTDQRRDQRDDKSDRQSEQGCLHGVSLSGAMMCRSPPEPDFKPRIRCDTVGTSIMMPRANTLACRGKLIATSTAKSQRRVRAMDPHSCHCEGRIFAA